MYLPMRLGKWLDWTLGLRFWSRNLGEVNPTQYKKGIAKLFPAPGGSPPWLG